MSLRSLLVLLARTPLHPQWLLGVRKPPEGLQEIRGTLLDVGSADGWIAKYLDPSVHYIALDTPTTGKNMYGARPTIFADGRKLPFADDCIDALVCLEVAEHVDAPDRLFSEAWRVLRPGGEFYFSVPFLYPIHDAPYDFQRFTSHGLIKMTNQAGLRVISIENKTGSIHVAGALVCLAIAGALTSGGWRFLLLPFAAPLVLIINLSAFFLGLFWPNWDAMTFGYALKAVKPDSDE